MWAVQTEVRMQVGQPGTATLRQVGTFLSQARHCVRVCLVSGQRQTHFCAAPFEAFQSACAVERRSARRDATPM